MLPAAGFLNRLAPPHARRAVEIKKHAAPRPARMLEHKVAVEQNGFDLRQQRIVAIDVRPARLHHADLRVGEMVDALEQKIARRHKIGIENRDELALGGF